MRCPKTVIMLFLVMLVFVYPAYSDVWYVPDSIATIQAAIDTAADLDYIRVAEGIYFENLNFGGKYIRLESLEGAGVTIIQPADPEIITIICDDGAGGYIDGFTISGGGNANTIDITKGADILVRNCIFHDNIPDNNYEHDVIFCDSAEVDIFRCLFYENGGDYCVSVYPSSGYSSLIHCTFNNNHKVAYSNTPFFEVSQCIISNCDSGLVASGYVDILAYLCDFWNCGFNYNEYCMVDHSTISHFDPLYVSTGLADYNLQEMSPCIDAGFAEHAGELDPDGTTPDLGALPFTTVFPIAAGINFVPSFDPLAYHFVNSLTPEITWNFDDGDRGTVQTQYQIQVGSDNDWAVAEMWDKGPEYSSDTSVVYNGLPLENHTIYYVRVRTHDGTDWGNWRLQWFHIQVNGQIYVPEQFSTIGEAIFMALDGDTIMVGPGEYNGIVNFGGRPLCIMSTDGPEGTTIITHAINGMGVDAVLSGFTLTGDYDNPLVSMSGNSRLSNCIIRDNTPDGDNAALVIASGSTVIESNIFYNNGGISCVGIGNYEDSVKIVNNVFDGNMRGIYNLVPNNSIAVNNIIINSRDYGVYGADNFMVFDANVVYGNGYNRMYWQSLGPHNMEFDPVFTDAANRDYSLDPMSPCIDNGYPDPVYNDEDGTRSDVGAIATSASFPIAADITFGADAVSHELFSFTPEFQWNYADTAATSQYQFEVKLTDDVTWQTEPIWSTGTILSGNSSLVYYGPKLVARKTYFVSIRVHNGADWGDWRVGWFKVQMPAMVRVPEHHESLFDAIDAALDGDTILVGPGTYAGRFYIDKGVRLISSHGSEATVLAPGPDYQEIIHVEDCVGCDTLEISGFTFAGGGWHNVVVIHRYSESAPVVVSNCVFDNCVGYDNAAAIRCYNGSVIVRNNVISNNIGRGIYINDDIVEATVVNNTIDDNYRGILVENHNTLVLNNIITRNDDYGIYATDSVNVIIDYNDFYGNTVDYAYRARPGQNDIYDYPQFVDIANLDYNLRASSPCIDAGHPDAQYNDPDGTRNDMGAYYFAHSLVIMNPDPILNTGEIDDTSLADIYFGNLIGDYTVNDVNTGALLVNGAIMPILAEIVPSHPEFTGEVLNIKVNLAAFLETYGPIYGLVVKDFTLSGEYNDATPFTSTGRVEILNAIPGDMNDDNGVDLLDITFAIEYLYMDGPAPNPVYGDVNADCAVNILDVVYLIAYIYQGGPAPLPGCW